MKKRIIAKFIAGLLIIVIACSFMPATQIAATEPEPAPITPLELPASEYLYDGDLRERINICADWKFMYQGRTLSEDPKNISYPDGDWEAISLPHTWNAIDGQNNPVSEGYARGYGWYRKNLFIDAKYEGKKLYIEFLAANAVSGLYVNGVLLNPGYHWGGYTAFRIDITDAVNYGANNLIAVMVDNRAESNCAPVRKSDQSVDFTIYGGLYREASLIVTEKVHIDMTDNASHGVFLSTPTVSKTSATLNIRSKIVNETASAKEITVRATLKHPDKFEEIAEIPNPRFDVSTMYRTSDNLVASVTETFTVPPGATGVTFNKDIIVDNPRLWNGIKDPYRYVVDLEVFDGTNIVDLKTQYIGFRFFHADSNLGFFLNGESYPIRGGNRHQDRIGMGNAITTKEHNEDFAIIYEMGATGMRLAHYPQAQYFYDLFDKYGIVVWAEIPFITGIAGSGAYASPNAARLVFMDSLRSQLVEMIRQLYNHPSILFWGLQNEVDSGQDAFMQLFMQELHNKAKAEDPYRYTTLASNTNQGIRWQADIRAWNRYDGWYSNNISQLGSMMDQMRSQYTPNIPLGISEYGAGGNPFQHTDRMTFTNANDIGGQGGQFHPEEFQSYYHEIQLGHIQARPWLWGTFFWNMFDFGMAGRNEGAQPGLNDKGAVTFDRKIKKDYFYLYKANLNYDETTVYITSRRFERRESPEPTISVPVKVYSNADSLTLYLNGVLMQTLNAPNQTHCGCVWLFNNISLINGNNIIKVVGIRDGLETVDEIVWKKTLRSSTAFTSSDASVKTDTNGKKILLLSTANLTVGQFLDRIINTNNCTFKVLLADGVTEANLSSQFMPGLKVFVLAEDEETTAMYEAISAPISVGRPNASIRASRTESGNDAWKAFDGDYTTRWSGYVSAGRFPEWIEIDLGDVYNLNQIDINWYGTGRTYYYTIWGKADEPWSSTVTNNRNHASLGYFDICSRDASQTLPDNTSDILPAGTQARYIVVCVTGGAGGAITGSMYEISIYGWKLSSAEYTVNDTSKTIAAHISPLTSPEEFMSKLLIGGNYASFAINSAGEFVKSGDKVIITEVTGGKVEYTLELTYDFDKAVFTDRDGNRILKLTADALVTRLPYDNKAGEAVDLTMFVAMYNKDGKMLLISSERKEIAANSWDYFEVALELPGNIDGAYATNGNYVHVFLWDSETFVPVCDKRVFP